MTESILPSDPYEHHLLSADVWGKCAQNIFQSAKQFESKVDAYWLAKDKEREDLGPFYQTYLMLCGYAFENIFKALIVQRKRDVLRDEYRNNGKFPQVLRSHVLSTLAIEAGLEVSEEATAKILKRMTRHSIWQGRYPFPLEGKDLPTDDVPFGQINGMTPINVYYSSDKGNIQTLFSLALHILEKRKSLTVEDSQALS